MQAYKKKSKSKGLEHCIASEMCRPEHDGPYRLLLINADHDVHACRLFDLRTGTERWKEAAPKGVCSVRFDRRDIPMNKMLTAGLDGHFRVFDARTQHPDQACPNPAFQMN